MHDIFYIPLCLVFVCAVVIHLASRFLLGPSADNMYGGALAVAFLQSIQIVREQDTKTACLFVVLMFSAAVCGHYLSQRVVSRNFPDFGKKKLNEYFK